MGGRARPSAFCPRCWRRRRCRWWCASCLAHTAAGACSRTAVGPCNHGGTAGHGKGGERARLPRWGERCTRATSFRVCTHTLLLLPPPPLHAQPASAMTGRPRASSWAWYTNPRGSLRARVGHMLGACARVCRSAHARPYLAALAPVAGTTTGTQQGSVPSDRSSARAARACAAAWRHAVDTDAHVHCVRASRQRRTSCGSCMVMQLTALPAGVCVRVRARK